MEDGIDLEAVAELAEFADDEELRPPEAWFRGFRVVGFLDVGFEGLGF